MLALSTKLSLAGFFKLPDLQRYRLIAAMGGGFLLLTTIARLVNGESEGFTLYTRTGAAFIILVFACWAHKFHFAMTQPHLAGSISLLPLLVHLVVMLVQTSMSYEITISCLVVSGIVTLVFSSVTYQRWNVIVWTSTFVVTAWLVPNPVLDPVLFTILVIAASAMLYVFAASFNSARLELEHKDQQLSVAQTFAGVGGWEHDFGTNRTVWSETAYEILKLPSESRDRVDIEPFIVGPVVESGLAQGFAQLLEKGVPYDVEEQVRTRQGDLIWLHSRGKPVYRQGKLVGVMGVFSNITPRIEYEQELLKAKEVAEAAVVSRTQFIANMSHEIRTPLNGVIGMASVLRSSNLSHEDQQSVDVITSCGKSLLGIVNDILDFSKLDSDKVELESLSFDPQHSVSSACDTVSASVTEKQLAFEVETPALDTYVWGDENRLRQVLVNLLSNAVKFTNEGGIKIKIHIEAETPTHITVNFAVIDSGIGISEAAQEHLFEAFTQADASTTRLYGGTGLGLAISSSLVSAMGGELKVRSAPGEGSEFGFQLQLKKATSPQLPDVTDATQHVKQKPALRILLAEDNLINQKVAVRMLARLGYATVIANNGREAVDMLQAEAYDLVLMDLQMPVLDGLDATKEIRCLSSIQQPHICALTANAMAHDRERCLNAGMDSFLGKPIRLQDLEQMLAAVLPS